MKVVKIVMTLCILFPFSTVATEAPNGIPLVLQNRAMKMVGELVEESFPELKEITFTPKLIKNPAVFLATDINIPSVLVGKREYILYLNKQLYTQPISDLALKGILAHELVHFTDYEKMNGLELAWFYAKILTSAAFETEYERATDLQTFERGYAIGIKAFRFWLYDQITPEAKVLKEKNYYTPEEIDDWLLNQQEVTLL